MIQHRTRAGAPLRVGVLGCGYIADLHLQALRRGGHVEVVAADVDDGAARHLVEQHGGRVVEPARLPQAGLDVAYLCTPHDIRSGPLEALLAEVPLVVCEKPLALDGERAHALAERLGGDGERLVVAFNQRFMPGVRALDAWLAGRRGDVRRVRIDVTSPPFLHTWAGTAERGGGVLACLGSHALDLWRHLLRAEPTDLVAATSHVRLPGTAEPDTATVVLRTADGALATVTAQDSGSTWWSMGVGRMLDLDVRTSGAAARAGAVAISTWDDAGEAVTDQALGSGDFLADWGYVGMADAVRRRLAGADDDDVRLLAGLADGVAVAELVDRARAAAAPHT